MVVFSPTDGFQKSLKLSDAKLFKIIKTPNMDMNETPSLAGL